MYTYFKDSGLLQHRRYMWITQRYHFCSRAFGLTLTLSKRYPEDQGKFIVVVEPVTMAFVKAAFTLTRTHLNTFLDHYELANLIPSFIVIAFTMTKGFELYVSHQHHFPTNEIYTLKTRKTRSQAGQKARQ